MEPTMTKPTPGPWAYIKCPCGHESCDRFVICHSTAEGMFCEADARLITAAPDLLDALRVLADRVESAPRFLDGGGAREVSAARKRALADAVAAVAKAEGR